MTREEKLQLNRNRQKAVREAWAREKNLVNSGKGTVDWTINQQKELLEKGHVNFFVGQHMKSVQEYPEYAGCVDNIQLLSNTDHLAAHNCSNLSEKKGFHSPTNGYYDTQTKTFFLFGDSPPRAPESFDLSNPLLKEFEIEKNMIKYNKELIKQECENSNIKVVSKKFLIER